MKTFISSLSDSLKIGARKDYELSNQEGNIGSTDDFSDLDEEIVLGEPEVDETARLNEESDK